MASDTNSLGKDSVGSLILRLSIPAIAAQIINVLYNIVDRMYIGHIPEIGKTALTGVGVTFPIIMLISAFSYLIGMGGAPQAAIEMGKGNYKRAEKILGTSFGVLIIISVVLTAAILIFQRPLLMMFGASEQTIEYAIEYLTIYTIGTIFVQLVLGLNMFITSQGYAKTGMATTLIGAILNIILDPVFIHFIGFHGAAIATLLSQGICLIFMVIYLQRKKLFSLHITWFNKADILPIIGKAIPSVIQQSIPAVSTTFLTALVSTYSITAIAAYGITGKLETILFYPAMALNMVLTAIVGQCIGGQRIDRAKDYLKCALKYGCVLLLTLSCVIVIFSRQLSGFFVSSTDTAAIVRTYFLTVCIGYVLNTVTNCFLGVLNGLGKPDKSMFLMIFYYIVVRMPLAYFLSSFGFGLNGIWAAVLVSHICAAAASMLVSLLSCNSILTGKK